jgi:ribosomal protein S12 methylthiotransferase accessory factor
VRPGAVVSSAAHQLSGRVVLPNQLALFRSSQHLFRNQRFPFARWSAEDTLGWVQGQSLVTGEPTWLPAVFVFQPYSPRPGEPLWAPTISTGLACHCRWEDAVLRGLLEVLERDAIALAWLGQVPPTRVHQSPTNFEDADLEPLVRRLDSMRFRWVILELTTEFRVPVFAALLVGHSAVGLIVSCGSACHTDPRQAMTKALIEAAHCRMFVKSLTRETPGWRCGKRFENVVSFADHARLYTTHPEHARALAAWWHASEKVEMLLGDDSLRRNEESTESQLGQVVRRLVRGGYEPFAVDLTSPDILPLGLHVARVIVPGLQPLHGNHEWPHLGGPRLRRLRHIFGPRARQPWRWNPWPHPFA